MIWGRGGLWGDRVTVVCACFSDASPLLCILDVAGNDYMGAVLLPITVVLWPI